MTKQKALKVIILISIAGILFSGYLSYRELFIGNCDLGIVACGTKTGSTAGLPACVYGFLCTL